MRSSTIIKTMGPLEWSLLIILSMLGGGAFFFSKVALAELRPFTVVLGRVGIAALVLNLIVRASGQRLPASRKTWGAFLVMGALNNLIPFSLIFWGETQIASGLASILNASAPLWTLLLAHLSGDERLTAQRLGGTTLGLLGVTVMIGPDVLGGLELKMLAQLAVLGAAFSYALAGIYGQRFRAIPPYVTAAGQITCTTLMMIPLALWVDQPWLQPLPGAKTWGALLALALLSTALAYVIYFRLLSTAGATNLLLVALLAPVSALLLGTGILGERLIASHFLGMGLIGLGLLVIDGRLLHKIKSWRKLPQRQLADDRSV